MGYFYESRCHDFGEPEGRVKIQETNKNIPRYYTLNRLIRDYIIQHVSISPKIMNFLVTRARGVGGGGGGGG